VYDKYEGEGDTDKLGIKKERKKNLEESRKK